MRSKAIDSQGNVQTSSTPFSDSLLGTMVLDEQEEASEENLTAPPARRVSADDFDLSVSPDLLPEEVKRRLRELVK